MLLLLAGATGFAAPAAAQRAPIALGASEDAALAPQGIPAGGFRVYPSVRAELVYDDNIFLRDTNVIGGAYEVVTPAVSARSDWNNHQLDLDAYFSDSRYFSQSSQNSDQYSIAGDGRLDIRRDLSVGATARYAQLVEQRGTPGNDLLIGRPVRYELVSFAPQISKRFDRITVLAGASGSNYRYRDVTLDDGTIVDQTFRNRDNRGLNGRVDYQYSAITSVFVTGGVNRAHYLNTFNGIDRSSHGYSALVGLKFEITRLLRGEASIGYISQSFRDPRFSSFGGLNYTADIYYAPTPLTSLHFEADRTLTDSAFQQVGGVLTSRFRLSASHQLLRRLRIDAFVEHDNDNFRGLFSQQNRFITGVSAARTLSSLLTASLAYSHRVQTGDRLHYSGNRFTAALTIAR